MSTKSFMIVTRRNARDAFTIVEMLVSVAVLVLLLVTVSQLMNSATAVTRTGNKHVDTDTQARTVLDRMAVDFAQMLKRTDIDYYVKAPDGYKNPKAHGNGLKLKSGQQGNDQIAFFSEVPGYYPTGYALGTQSPLSLVAYRVVAKNSDPLFLQLQRMGKGLLWNGVDITATKNSNYPIIFAPGQIAAGTGPWAKNWPWYFAVNNDNTSTSTSDPDYEVIGPGVFRLEYYYLLKDGTVTDAPKIDAATSWDSAKTVSANLNAFKDVEAIVAAIAVVDPATRSLLYDSSTPGNPYHVLFNLMSDMADFKNANGIGIGAQKIGDVENEWNTAINNAATKGKTSDGLPFPPAAASAIRIYSRYFDLRTL